jgi:hypothetical protein
LGHALHDIDVNTQLMDILGSFKTNKPSANDSCALWVVCGYKFANVMKIGNCMQAENVRTIQALYRRHKWLCANSENKLIVRHLARFLYQEVDNVNCATVSINVGDVSVNVDIDIESLFHGARRMEQQSFSVSDYWTKGVRKSTVRKADVRSPFKDRDLGRFAQSSRSSCCRHASCNPTDNDDSETIGRHGCTNPKINIWMAYFVKTRISDGVYMHMFSRERGNTRDESGVISQMLLEVPELFSLLA